MARNKHFPGAPAGWIPQQMREPMWKRTGRLWFWCIPAVGYAVLGVGAVLMAIDEHLRPWLYPH